MSARSPAPTIAVLLSGGGRTALNLLKRFPCTAGRSRRPRVVAAIASRADCAGVARLQAYGMRVDVVSRRDFPDETALHDRTDELLLASGTDLVCLCGWLRKFRMSAPPREEGGAPRVDWNGRVMNIHPSLLPAFGGQGMHGDHVHAAVLASGATHSGCTVHYVDDQYDHGPIILQRIVPVLPADDVSALAERVFAQECLAYPEAVLMHAEGVVAGEATTRP